MKKTTFIAILAAFTTAAIAQTNPQPQNNPSPNASPVATSKAPEKPAKPAKKEMKKVEMVMGEITAINTEKNEITVKTKTDNTEKTFAVDAKEISKLKVGEEVNIKLVNGEVKKIKEVKHEKKHKKGEKKEVKKEEKAENKPAEKK